MSLCGWDSFLTRYLRVGHFSTRFKHIILYINTGCTWVTKKSNPNGGLDCAGVYGGEGVGEVPPAYLQISGRQQSYTSKMR